MKKKNKKTSKKSKTRITKKTTSTKEGWEHGGGGCMLFGKEPRCDDSYFHTKTGKEAVYSTTTEAHFNMPRFVKDLAEIDALPGVKRVQE